MSDPLRTETARTPDAVSSAERDAKIEHLLLVGLDHYCGAKYDEAINVWTRALFLDRSHARARAYIERARSALAERQREADELLQSGLGALKTGQTAEARQLLRAAVASGAAGADEALAMLDRLEGLAEDAAARPVTEPRAKPPIAPRPSTPSRPASSKAPWVFLIGAIMLMGVGALLASGGIPQSWRSMWPLALLDATPPPPAPLALPDQKLPMPRRGEMALARARALSASGHLHEALGVLDEIKITDPEKAAADELRASVQRTLIEFAPAPGPAPSGEGTKPGEGPEP
jgi:tetratricopeptide (TPR) repeat protein